MENRCPHAPLDQLTNSTTAAAFVPSLFGGTTSQTVHISNTRKTQEHGGIHALDDKERERELTVAEIHHDWVKR